MKSLILFLILLITIPSKARCAEKDTLFLKDIYSNLSTKLISDSILKFDSISKADLLLKFENWAGQNFRNYNEVLTSKTPDLITINYITSSFNLIDMYLILIAEFKDNKMRIKIYDDGNVYKPGSYAGSTYVPAIPSRTYHIFSYFKDDMIIYKPAPSLLNIKQKQASGALNYKYSALNTISNIEQFVKSNNYSKDQSDW